jgi:hypothetical protein
MLALVGSDCSSFDHGRQQMELLADLEVTTKAVERVTETIGEDIARRQQQRHPNDETAKRRWVMACQHLLDDGKIEKLVVKLRTLSPEGPELAAVVQTEANYFERNAERMRYPAFRRKDSS